MRLLLAVSAALILGCDTVTATRDAATAARPEGWESLEDEGQAVRLYYQFVDERRQVRFVETLEDVPEALRAGVGFVKMAVPPPLSPGDAARARAAPVEKTGQRAIPVIDVGGRILTGFNAAGYDRLIARS